MRRYTFAIKISEYGKQNTKEAPRLKLKILESNSSNVKFYSLSLYCFTHFFLEKMRENTIQSFQCILGDNFFLFWQNLKNEDSKVKKRFLEGSKKVQGKKVIKSKNDCNKSRAKFYKLGDDFFLFWQNLKNEDSTAKKCFLEGSGKAWGKKVIK